MERLLAIIGVVVGSWAGWWIGGRMGVLEAWVLSMVGLGFGLYRGRRIGRDYF